MKDLDKATAGLKKNRSAHQIFRSPSLKSRNKDRVVLNKSQNLVTFDEKKPLGKEDAKSLM